MKTDTLDKVRKNRNRLFEFWRSHPSTLDQNIAIARNVTNMWFNPSSSGKLKTLRQELLDTVDSISTIDQVARPLEIIESIDAVQRDDISDQLSAMSLSDHDKRSRSASGSGNSRPRKQAGMWGQQSNAADDILDPERLNDSTFTVPDPNVLEYCSSS
eukprot:COSAG02_NODE_51_length_44689_cov_29.477361_39_plen_158_part_00